MHFSPPASRSEISLRVGFVLLLLSLGSGLVACGGANGTRTMDAMPPDFSIVIGSGGGYSGMWEGHRIDADGAVTAWSGVAEREEARRVGSLSESHMASLWQRIHDDGLLDLQISESGNLTTFIEMTANGSTRRLSWATGSQAEDPTSTAASVYQYVRDVIATEASDDQR